MSKEVAVLGVGMHPWGKWGQSFVGYGVKAAQDALKDAGLQWKDIQLVAGGDTIRNGYPGFVAGATFAQALGWSGAKVSSSYGACATGAQAISVARAHILAGLCDVALVIGAEILSRVCDPHDVDGMIYSDGAGATLVEASDKDGGILSHVTRSDTYDKAYLLGVGKSYNPSHCGDELYIKMQGHEIYKYAVRTVPEVVKQSLDKAELTLTDVNKVLVHQANQKMDEAILARLFKLYQVENIPEHIMPMTISWLGNSSVATLPTMLDLLQRGNLDNHELHSGDVVVFASVGAGMNVNSMVYKMP